jgi:8-oxo-dGTP pyrophosphatase MutT (NUDIX family)
MSLLDFDPDRDASAPVDAATAIIVRDAESGLQVFCVERSKKSRWLGGVIVFPGGKVDPADHDPAFAEGQAGAPGDLPAGEMALAVAAARESLEEAAIFPGSVSHAEALALRQELAAGAPLLDLLRKRGVTLDARSLLPFARWVTPTAEKRRFDARFFLLPLPEGQEGLHDDTETVSSFWASPKEVLARFENGHVQLVPPTHRSLEILAAASTVAEAIAIAAGANKAPVCPRLVRHTDARGETLALALPGDPDHPVQEVRVPGLSRYVLRDERWLPEPPPAKDV